jgi:hydrogenase expression/formation protein HypE
MIRRYAAEITQSAGISINISEQNIPVGEHVRGICEILGLDPIFLANEGKMVAFCPQEGRPKFLL